ncbi:MAG: hypothetical protein AB8B99_22780 [Phormidesmis sp.]
MKKSISVLISALLSTFLTSCLKSSEPVVFSGYQVSPATVTGLGSILADADQTPIKKAFQLRTEGRETYLYVCNSPNASEVKKIRAYVSAIPNQAGLYVLSLETGNFFYEDNYANSFFNELFLLQPLADKMVVRVMDTSDGDTISNFFRGLSKVPAAIEYGAQAYTADHIKEFLMEHADEYISEDMNDSAYSYYKADYTYYRGTLDTCNWN